MVDVLPHGEEAVGSRWALSYKSDHGRQNSKMKARLDRTGFIQREGIGLLSNV